MPLAHCLRQRLEGTIAWQLVARNGVDTAEARVLVARSVLHPADVIVTALGVNDVGAQRSASAFAEQTKLLWRELRERSGAHWGVVSGLPPMHLLTALPQPLRWYLGRYAQWLDGALRQWAAQQGLGYCPLQWASDPAALASDGFHPGPSLYPRWALRLAEIIAESHDRWAPRP
jgi:lysophospholipase L1-like esterase